MKRLRRIALWVDETESGCFRWLLTEVGSAGALRDIDCSVYEFATYHGALAEGVDALQLLCHDPDIGPREGDGGDPAERSHGPRTPSAPVARP